MKINEVNIGLMITSRINQLHLSKSEFGRKIGVPQQNVNRILERANIDTEKLIQISEALDFNFFELYSSIQVSEHYVGSGPHAIVAKNIDKIDNRGMVEIKEETDEQTKIILGQTTEEKDQISLLHNPDQHTIDKLTLEVKLLKDLLASTKSQLEDKERFIAHLLNSKQ